MCHCFNPIGEEAFHMPPANSLVYNYKMLSEYRQGLGVFNGLGGRQDFFIMVGLGRQVEFTVRFERKPMPAISCRPLNCGRINLS